MEVGALEKSRGNSLWLSSAGAPPVNGYVE